MMLSSASFSVCAKEPVVGKRIETDVTEDVLYEESDNDIYEGKAIACNETNFPDSEFRRYLNDCSYVKNGYVYPENIKIISIGSTSIGSLSLDSDVTEKKYDVKDLTGIEYFSNLESLFLRTYGGNKLDISKNTKLKKIQLSCWGNWGGVMNLKKLDTSKNPLLEEISVQRTSLEELDVTNNPNLKSLNCEYSNMKSLKLGNNAKLERLSCGLSNLASLNLSGCTGLKWLSCYDTNIKKLDLSRCTNLANTVDGSFGVELGDYENYESIIFNKNCKATICMKTKNTSSLLDISKIKGLNFSGKAYNAQAKTLDLDELATPFNNEGYTDYQWAAGENGTNASFQILNHNESFNANETATVSYQTHVQSIGWQKTVTNGTMAGTSGMGKRLEGIKINVSGIKNLGIKYTTHVQTYGWQGFKYNGQMSGTSGQAKRLEAICINLTGEMAKHYDVYYRVHAQTFGWLNWTKNGQPAGTAGLAKRLEGIQIVLVPKGGAAPAQYYEGIQSVNKQAYIQK